ncbi:MAG: hypothetical protein Q8936_24410 [Bacillota bacterium]|nr:hypothetical protein [Bacillota bacterium]
MAGQYGQDALKWKRKTHYYVKKCSTFRYSLEDITPILNSDSKELKKSARFTKEGEVERR